MGRKSDFRRSLIDLCKQNQHIPYSQTRRSGKDVSYKSRKDRRDFMMMMVDIVHGADYRITHYKNFDSRHLKALIEHMDAKGYAAGTMQNKLTFTRMYLGWIGKDTMKDLIKGMLNDPKQYKRTYSADRDRSWTPELYEKTVEELALTNTSMAVALVLMDAFGLRVKEALLLRPDSDLEGDKLELTRGTKGGRPRTLPIETEYQRDVMTTAKYQARLNGGSLIPKRISYKKWRDSFYYYMIKLGITVKAEGFTCHGLRHGYVQKLKQERTGKPVPIRDGVKHDLVAWETARTQAHETVQNEVMMEPGIDELAASRLGHSRPQITDMYVGRE